MLAARLQKSVVIAVVVDMEELTSTQSRHGHISLAQSADHQEDPHIGGSIVDRDGGAGNRNIPLRAGRDIDIVVSSSVVANVLQRLGQHGEHLRVKRTGVLFKY